MAEQPSHIGRFPILKTLGVGGMGVVYLGEDPDIGRKVAIKVLHATDDKEALERFKNEARTMGEISHPNIVILLEYGIEDKNPFLVMEYLPGKSLEDWIKENHTLQEHKKILVQLCSAIDFAHSKGILHRDLKPANIQVIPSGDAKLLDFGIATGQDKGLTATGFFIGTPKYLAPEILQDTTHTKKSDCYSLALLAYTMLSGKNPFAAATFEASMTRLLTKIPVSLHTMNASIPTKLSDTIDKYLSKSPDQRPETTKELQMALELISSSNELTKVIKADVDTKEYRSQERTVLIGEKPKNNTKLIAIAATVIALGAVSFIYKTKLDANKLQEQQRLIAAAKKEQEAKKPVEIISKKEDIPKKETNDSENINNDQELVKKDEVEKTDRENQVKPKEQVAIEKPVKKPVKKPIRKPISRPKPKPVVVVPKETETYNPPIIVYQNPKPKPKKDIKPIFKLPDFNQNNKSVKLTTKSDTQVPRGRTKTINIKIPNGINIDKFKIMRGLSEFNQVEIRSIRKSENNRVAVTLYAQSNATMGDFSIVGFYQNKKTKPLILEVAL